jgi:hypothetical protein
VIGVDPIEVVFLATGQTVTLSDIISVVEYGPANMKVPEYTADVVELGISCVMTAALEVGVISPNDVVLLDKLIVASSEEADGLDGLLIAYVIQLQAELKAVLWTQFEKSLGMGKVELAR